MKSKSKKITLPISLNMKGKRVALFEINSTVHPYTPKALFLCIDFIESSIVNLKKQMPVLRRINLKRKGKNSVVVINLMYTKILWLLTNHSPIKEIRVYIMDENGNAPPFQSCNVIGTLLCIPHIQ